MSKRSQPVGDSQADDPTSSKQRKTDSGPASPRAEVIVVGRCELEGCEAGMSSWKQYLEHLQAEHAYDFERRCDLCLTQLPASSKITAHRRMHLRENWKSRRDCLKCDASFFGKKKWERHMLRFHRGPAPLFHD